MQIKMDQILLFAKTHFEKNVEKSTLWNGRQIRNACQAAAALAEHEAYGADESVETPESNVAQFVARLEVRHFQKVDTAMRDFNDYMINVCGEDFSGIAKMKSERDDDFEPPRRYQEQHFGYEHQSLMPSSVQQSDRYPSNDGLVQYGGGYAAQRAGPYGPPDQRPRQRWAPSSREQERSHFSS